MINAKAGENFALGDAGMTNDLMEQTSNTIKHRFTNKLFAHKAQKLHGSQDWWGGAMTSITPCVDDRLSNDHTCVFSSNLPFSICSIVCCVQ